MNGAGNASPASWYPYNPVRHASRRDDEYDFFHISPTGKERST